jgi:Tol biopolymer transport system component
MPGYVLERAGLFPDGRRLWFVGSEKGRGVRGYVTDLSGAKPREATPEGRMSLSPDGAYFLCTPPAGRPHLYPTAGGAAQEIPTAAGERVAGWSADGQEVFVLDRNGLPARVSRLNWKTGHRAPLLEITPADRAGVDGIETPAIALDGKAYAYSYMQSLSELHMVEGLK